MGAAATCFAFASGSCSANSASDSKSGGTGNTAGSGGSGATGGIGLDGSAASGGGPPTGARYEGKVWGPHHDGVVPFFPVPGALVAAFAAPPPPMTQGAACRECVAIPEGTPYTTSAADGSFSLDIPPGKPVYLVVQKGEFRRVRQLTAESAIGVYPLDPDFSSLPHINDDGLGDHVPRMALVYGDYDHIEDVLAKTGFAADDGAYGVNWNGQVTFDVYNNAGPSEPTHGAPLTELIQNPAKLAEYDVILFACSYNANFAFMQDLAVQQNLKTFVWGGGKLYVSDYAMPVVEMPWQSFAWFTDPLHGGCSENQFPPNCNHGPPFESPATSPDSALAAWLDAQGLLADLHTDENWNTIGSLGTGEVGKDPATGQPLIQGPKTWVEGPWSYAKDDLEGVGEDPATWDLSSHPQTLSWPYNCGRVLYTTYHTVGTTAGGKHPDLLPQEMILFYLLMEITVCPEIPIVK